MQVQQSAQHGERVEAIGESAKKPEKSENEAPTFFALHLLARVPNEKREVGERERREVVDLRVGTEKRGGGWVKVVAGGEKRRGRKDGWCSQCGTSRFLDE